MKCRHGPFTLLTSDPFLPGHICSARDARDLNVGWQRRLLALARSWERRRGRSFATQEELDAWLTPAEGRLRASPSTLARSGYEQRVLELAEETYERGLAKRPGLTPTTSQRLNAISALRACGALRAQARAETSGANAEKLRLVLKLLGEEP